MNKPMNKGGAMTNRFRNFSILMLALATLGATAFPAQAKFDLNIDGSPGDAGARAECPAGQMLVGFSGRTGTWIDRIQIMCARPLPGGHVSQPVAVGPEYGGAGGGRVDSHCPLDSMMNGALVVLTTGKRQVAAIKMSCTNPATNEFSNPVFGNDSYRPHCPGIGVGDCPPDPNSEQYCSNKQGDVNGDVPVGINVRYGKHVNGIGFICGRVAATAPPPAAAPAPHTVITTGKPKAPEGPPVAPSFAFTGTWNTVTNQNGHFLLTFTPLDRELLPGSPTPIRFQGTFVNTDGASNTNGTIQGTVVNGYHDMAFTYVQPGLGLTGTGGFTLSADGNSITGSGVSGGKDKFTWTGTRKR